ncbi:hypothetical protein WICPIJ_004287 [Wickerhamomyces pijperi]|uniref:Uncharacterized protein n=1 Tax=Wickerhamomyces pijperi TaxID=599730 RepID=A0A9P8TNF7_WICPI|nr:hypothetical protein WICPIJ_004287 [Wickerhamomyces pijperi]
MAPLALTMDLLEAADVAAMDDLEESLDLTVSNKEEYGLGVTFLASLTGAAAAAVVVTGFLTAVDVDFTSGVSTLGFKCGGKVSTICFSSCKALIFSSSNFN